MASNTSRLGRSARPSMSLADIALPPIVPPLMIKNGLVLAASFNALATPAASPLMKVMALGPISNSARLSTPAFSAPNRANVFLYTLYSPPLLRRLRRRVASWPTLMPRYSVTIVASAAVSLAETSSTTATFSARGFSVVMYTSSRFYSWCSHCSEHREERGMVPDFRRVHLGWRDSSHSSTRYFLGTNQRSSASDLCGLGKDYRPFGADVMDDGRDDPPRGASGSGRP